VLLTVSGTVPESLRAAAPAAGEGSTMTQVTFDERLADEFLRYARMVVARG